MLTFSYIGGILRESVVGFCDVLECGTGAVEGPVAAGVAPATGATT